MVSRLITRAGRGRAAGGSARHGRLPASGVWSLAGDRAPGGDGALIPVDIDATVVTAHSEKEKAAPTWKKTFHPLATFADHRTAGTGEALVIMLRPGTAGSNTASEHIETARLALAQLPRRLRRRVLIRTDSGGGTHDFLASLASPGRRLHYSVGMTITEDMHQTILNIPDRIWETAYDADRRVRPGAWVAEITGLLDLSSWPAGMRVIVRKERPHPARSCGSPTLMGTVSPASLPTPRPVSSLTWNCVTGAGHDVRTGSAPPRTPGCVTCPCTASPRTRSGASWWPWPAS